MPLGSRVRGLIERVVPWFDRTAQDRTHARVHAEIRASEASRQVAERVIAQSGVERIRAGYRAAGDRLDR